MEGTQYGEEQSQCWDEYREEGKQNWEKESQSKCSSMESSASLESPAGGLSLLSCPEPGHMGCTLAAFISQCLDAGCSVKGP